MDCKEFEALIDAYLEDELTRDKKEEFTAHISSCENCRQALAFAESVKNTLSALPPIDVPADFTEKLHEKLAAEKKHSSFPRFAKRYGAIAACLILAAVIGTGIMRTDFSNKFDFSGQDITIGQNTAGETSPTNDEMAYKTNGTDTASLITPRGSENVPASTPAPAKSRMAEPSLDTAKDVTAIVEAYTLEDDLSKEMATSPIVITASGVGGDFAKELALMNATLEDGIYTMDKDEFNNFISALETIGIEFTQSRDAEEDTVKFKIVIN